jgi:hypothetical protein
MPTFDRTPDGPDSFGYKVSWFAVRAGDAASVVQALELGPDTAANWQSGLAAMYDSSDAEPWIFVSPPVGGWVLVVGSLLPYPVVGVMEQAEVGAKFNILFSRLTKRFAEVQFFGSYRVVDFVSWARARNGQPIRMFSYADGVVYANVGAQTPEEARLGFVDLTGLSPEAAVDKMFKVMEEQEGAPPGKQRLRAIPGETDVLNLAAAWGVNPMDLPDAVASVGLAVRLPRSLGQ